MTTTKTTAPQYRTVDGVTVALATDPGGTPRGLLRVALWEACGGVCAICGQDTILDGRPSDANLAELSHIVPGYAGSKTGVQDGNIFIGCRRCNINSDQMTDGNLTPFINKFERADLIPSTLPAGWRQWKKEQNMTDHANNSNIKCESIFN